MLFFIRMLLVPSYITFSYKYIQKLLNSLFFCHVLLHVCVEKENSSIYFKGDNSIKNKTIMVYFYVCRI